MTTPPKAAANAANARFSTGPRTVEGKAQSSRNALKHGLTAQEVVVREDQQQEFNDLRDFMLVDLNPEGAIEIETFNILLHASWNLRRFRALESALMVNGLDPLLDESSARTLDRLHRYHAQALRDYHKALSQLRALQTSRAMKETILEEPDAEGLPALVSMNELLRRTHAQIRVREAIPASSRSNRVPVQNEPTGRPREGADVA